METLRPCEAKTWWDVTQQCFSLLAVSCIQAPQKATSYIFNPLEGAVFINSEDRKTYRADFELAKFYFETKLQ